MMKIEFALIALVFLAPAESAEPQIRYSYQELAKDQRISLEESVTGDTEFHLEFPVATQDLETTSLQVTRYPTGYRQNPS